MIENRCGKGRFNLAVLPDHKPRPPGDRGNLALALGPKGKSAVQVFDQAVDSFPVLFFDARHAPKIARAFGVFVGFRDGDRLLVSVDPVVNYSPALGEQTQKVIGLSLIRRLRHSSGAVDIAGRPVHGQRRHRASLSDIDRSGADRAAVSSTPAQVTSTT
jgi:hypothetical protein